MGFINVMEDYLVIEGIIASLMFPLTKFFLIISKGQNLFWYLFWSWFITWYLRKYGAILYKKMKEKYQWKSWYLKGYVPFVEDTPKYSLL